MNSIDFSQYGYKKYSQFNQDGIIEKIFDSIGTTNKFFVEFGSNGFIDGGGNTAYLRERFGMDGLLMDGSEHPYHEEDDKNPDFERRIEFVSAENINSLFEKYSVPSTFDFLSVDIDGEDYWVMKSLDLEKHRPRVICVETNWHMHPSLKIAQKHNPNHVWGGTKIFGCSSSAMTELLNTKGYSMVAYTGPDCIYIEDKEIDKNNLDIKGRNDPTSLGVIRYGVEYGVMKHPSFFDGYISTDFTTDI